jgi:hypothetical protein
MSIEPDGDLWTPADTPVYLCFDAEDLYAARMIRGYPLANQDLNRYVARENAPLDGAAGQSIQSQLDRQLRRARVLVCLIGPLTSENDWVAWELESAKSLGPRPGLVAAYLDERHARPSGLLDSGAVFVPFNHDHLERAVRWACTSEETREDFEFRDMAW